MKTIKIDNYMYVETEIESDEERKSNVIEHKF